MGRVLPSPAPERPSYGLASQPERSQPLEYPHLVLSGIGYG